MRRQSGFTLAELMVVIAIIALLTSVAVPNFLSWLPKYRLKSAADELFTNLNLAKLTAVRNGEPCAVSFTANGYTIDSLGRSINLADYGSGVTFALPPGETGSAFPSSITFDTRGLSSTWAAAYLSNGAHTGYFKIGTLITGVVRIQKWSNGTWH